MTRTTSELAPPLQTCAPHQKEDVWPQRMINGTMRPVLKGAVPFFSSLAVVPKHSLGTPKCTVVPQAQLWGAQMYRCPQAQLWDAQMYRCPQAQLRDAQMYRCPQAQLRDAQMYHCLQAQLRDAQMYRFQKERNPR
ncbi:hypothetical protein AVEN_222172-1 [Araneus ventricosus]|uniref:Uncharacterized protein n=1 Tax=Araneus ventricosus TaxID=182803 RepID=A0A4Y2FRD5_ARAVE|nr:hypothetical protein AVEN_222172-1 [Araneus ventricosus]